MNGSSTPSTERAGSSVDCRPGCTLVGLTRNGSPVYGMMNQPHVGERFIGDGKSARLVLAGEERMLATRRCTSLADAFIATTNPRIIKGADGEAYDRLEARCKFARYGNRLLCLCPARGRTYRSGLRNRFAAL